PLLAPVATIGHATLANALRVQKLDELFAPARMADLFAPLTQHHGREVLSKMEMPSDHEVVEDGHAVEEAEVLQRPSDPMLRHGVRRPAEERLASEGD